MAYGQGQVQITVMGVDEIAEFFRDLGKVPQKTVKKAAKAGAVVVKKTVKNSSQVPVRDGFLRASLIEFEAEKKAKGKRNVSGRAAFDVGSDDRYGTIFQKKYKGNPRRGSKSPRMVYYYPASMEYGFANEKGGVGGHHYLRDAGITAESTAQDKMLEVISKDIDRIKNPKPKKVRP